MRVLYTLIVELSRLFLPIGGILNPAIKQFLKERKTTFQDISKWKSRQSDKPVLWLHCASLGEYEMIVPLISEEVIQSKFEIVVSFFSSSGYNYAKSDDLIDCKFYLPIDRQSDMKKLVSLVNPTAFVLVKYDFWLNLLRSVNNHNCTVILVNGLFRKKQFITSFFAGSWRNELKKFNRTYVQNEDSKKILEGLSFSNVELSNDLRYDRVIQLKSLNQSIPKIQKFTNGQPTLILGSSWEQEEYIALQYVQDINDSIKLIIAPHDVSLGNIERLQSQYQKLNPKLITETGDFSGSRVLILNTIGQLSSSYHYATIAFVGGAFGKGLHNILEAAVHGIPIFTGPNIDKFPEAKALEKLGVLQPVDQDPRHFIDLMAENEEEENHSVKTKEMLSKWFSEQTGHTKQISEYLVSASQ
jgi:3-deoxy-D-manno-octulosonic-acid transferase